MRPAWIALAAGLALSSPPAPPGAGGTARPLDAAISRGLAYLASVWDGASYADPYLEYVYPRESLRSASPGLPVTYRRIDAYVDLLLLRDALEDRGPVEGHSRLANRVIRELPSAWRGQGLYNVTRDPDPNGIALDTYCIVGLLNRDAEMAQRVAGAFDGAGWLPAGFYGATESFRAVADESWCVRLLQAAGPPAAPSREMLGQVLGRAAQAWRHEGSAEARAYIALHALHMLLEAAGQTHIQDRRFWLQAVLGAVDDPSLQEDLLMQANLLEGIVRAGSGEDPAAGLAARRLIAGQEGDGGWPSRIGESGPRLRSFTTLRALIALARHRATGKSAP